MKDWIEQNIDPPGMKKKNRFSVFSTIGAVADIARADALKAFNAHFPYLCDEVKLEEHGKALLVPRLLYDTPKEYRDRVAAASFFLMRAGERGYINEQLAARFQDRLSVREEFLRIYLEILGLTNTDRLWAFGFLDAIIDPNVSFKYVDKELFIDSTPAEDEIYMIANSKNFTDVLSPAEKTFAFSIRLENHDIFMRRAKYNGKYKYNGGITYNHYEENSDPLKITVYTKVGKYNGDFKYDGSRKYGGIINNKYNGAFKYDGTRKYSGTGKVKQFEEVL